MNEISLSKKQVKPVIELLNDYLANYHIHYQKLRGMHWNIKGENFFTLHLKFEELYNNAQTTIDAIAERILTLGKSPYSTYAEYIKVSEIQEVDTVDMADVKMVKEVINDMTKLIELERDIMEAASKAGDEGTNDMVNAFMQFKEKTTWMMKSFIGKSK